MKDSIPQKSDVFDVYTVSHGNLHRCSPFAFTDEDPGNIYADDEDGDPWIFRKSNFVFKEVKKPPTSGEADGFGER